MVKRILYRLKINFRFFKANLRSQVAFNGTMGCSHSQRFQNDSRGKSRGRVQGGGGGGGGGGPPPPPPPPEMTCGFLIQLVFCKKKIGFIGVEVKSKRRVHPLLKEILDPPLDILLSNSHVMCRFANLYFAAFGKIGKKRRFVADSALFMRSFTSVFTES